MDDNARSEEFCYTRLASGNSIAKLDSVQTERSASEENTDFGTKVFAGSDCVYVKKVLLKYRVKCQKLAVTAQL